METLHQETGNTTNLEEINSINSTPLVVDPESLEGVASAYRYKLTIKNPNLMGATFHFSDSLDVFSFNAVDKKRALKKEEWPTTGNKSDPNKFIVKVHLMAGNVEIQNCDGCASWKEKTRKPFLVLTPTGERCVQFQKNPFLLLIFRCCPKFHSCNKQFRLVLSLSSCSGDQIFSQEVNIYRKKMVSSRKRKNSSSLESSSKIPSVVKSSLNLPLTTTPSTPSTSIFSKTQNSARENNTLEHNFPLLCNGISKPMQLPLQLMVSTQLMYQLLYCDGKSQVPSENCGTELIDSKPVMKKHEVYHYSDTPVVIKKDIKLEEPKFPPLFAPNYNQKVPNPSWKFDSYRMNTESAPHFEISSDEKWLDSVFSEINGPCSLPRTLDDISALLDLPDDLPSAALGIVRC